MQAALQSVASARSLVVVTIAVVTAFLLATAVSQLVDSKSAQDIDDIVGNAMPSVQMLSSVRGELRRIEDDIVDLERGDSAAIDEITESRRNIDVALNEYHLLPYFPGEAEMFAKIPPQLAALDAALARLQAGSRDASDTARGRIDVLDRMLERSVNFDAAQGQRLGLSIARARSRSRIVVWAIDSASVFLAMGAVALAMRQRKRSIHVLREKQAINERRLEELKSQVDELGNFAGRVAHDLRSPLQIATLALDIVDERSPDAMTDRAVTSGAAALVRMRLLVEGLLSFARAGGKPESGASADASAVIGDIAGAVADEARARSIELHVAAVPGARVACSVGVLTSIVANLVRNALRHMGDSVERRVEVRVSPAGSRWRVEVQDTGPGIPAGQEQRIFEPYVQVSTAREGVGLGLATVERLVRAHGGKIGVVSTPGHGASFWFELPAATE